MPYALIDFGDMSRSWLAAECAIVAASLCTREPERALQNMCEVVSGFHVATPLLDSEIAALPDLLVARGGRSRRL